MDTTVADPLLGVLVDGRYRVRARVARGGMATVYTALDERLERTVALKIIHPAQSHDPSFVERFTDEAKTIARLTHPNVVSVYDQGSHQGLPYLVMEYVRGRTLREVLGERRRLQPQEALAVLDQMLAAIAAAHRAGLVHRDVKPENVLVAEAPGGTQQLIDAVVKVADFGLARAVEASADENGAHLMATVAYVAPELVTDGHADPRTDVYSAGIVLFEMLTGRVPYDGNRPVDVAWQHVDRDVPPPSHFVPGLPGLVDDLVARATRRDPGARPTDAGALLAEVQAAREDIGLALADQSRPLTQPTVIVPQVGSVPQTYRTGEVLSRDPQGDRPSWARLPSSGRQQPPATRRRRAAPVATGPAARFNALLAQINANPRTRITVIAALLTLGLLVAVGGYWFGVGRYTDAPQLTGLSQADAEKQAMFEGFKIHFAKPRFSTIVDKDKVLDQEPKPGARIRDGGTITLTVSLGPEVHKVPEIIGKAYELAVDDLNVLKLSHKKAEKFDDGVPAGHVADTEPKAGSVIKPETPITVFVSKGPNPIRVPLVVGKNVEEAKPLITKAGIKLGKIEEVDSDKPKGQVLEQSLGDGASVQDGMVMDLKISKGPPFVVVPNVVGMPLDEARKALEALGLQIDVRGFPNGTVRAQNPPEGTQLPPGSRVELTVFF